MTNYIAAHPCNDFKPSKREDVCINCGWGKEDHREEYDRWETEGGR